MVLKTFGKKKGSGYNNILKDFWFLFEDFLKIIFFAG
jgi:hypothetical protein